MNAVPQAPLILITGGSRGVGAATARLAAAQGYDVAISFVSNEFAALAVAADVEAVGRRALPMRADSADPGQVARRRQFMQMNVKQALFQKAHLHVALVATNLQYEPVL
jgi:NAD(P)-dependent dehydrogenase (short-subunit alcohol dehydrogenase family)